MIALIVDDDALARMALADLLGGYAMFELVEAADGAAAWALLAAGLAPAICFCDVRMPQLSGIGLLEKIRAEPTLAALPVVLVSAASDRETVLQAVQLGAVGYLLKPLQPNAARTHLDKIFRLSVDKLAEAPGATLHRLNIGSARLAAYLDAFAGQLAAARAALEPLLAAGRGADALLRIEAMHNGCMTLGLWQAGAQLQACRDDMRASAPGVEPDAAPMLRALDGAAAAVARQGRRARAAFGLAEAGEGQP